jgi:putative sigma-54 modulation protein
MNISITFRHMESTESLKAHAEEKVAKLQKFLRQPMTARVTYSVEKHGQLAEVQISSGSEHHEAKESSTDAYSALDGAIAKLERQIRETKGAADAKRRHSGETLRGRDPEDVL